jgi:hypothetical protein
LEGFAGAQQRPHQESASALAARKAAVALDASEVVQMLRARL